MPKWMKAETMPLKYEGTRMWMWMDGMREPVYTAAPLGYDRRAIACAGVWFKPYVPVKPPELPST